MQATGRFAPVRIDASRARVMQATHMNRVPVTAAAGAGGPAKGQTG